MEQFRYQRESEPTPEELQPLFRGVWANGLHDGQELPLGASIFSDRLDGSVKLYLDFETFDSELGGFTEENIRQFFEDNKELYLEYLHDHNIDEDVDPYMHFACFQVQKKVEQLLDVDPVKKTNAFERNQMYAGNMPKLSEMKGKTMCGERAALAQYILRKIGVESAYVSGVTASGERGDNMEDHSYIVIVDAQNPDNTFVFDVARPHEGSGVPAIYKTDERFDYDSVYGKEEYLIGGTEVLIQNRVYFGVGDANLMRE